MNRTLAAFLRQGHKEIGRLFNAVEEPGQIGTATPLAVSIQTGVSPQPQNSREMQNMAATEPHEFTAEPILDQLIDQAHEMSQAPEIEQDLER